MVTDHRVTSFELRKPIMRRSFYSAIRSHVLRLLALISTQMLTIKMRKFAKILVTQSYINFSLSPGKLHRISSILDKIIVPAGNKYLNQFIHWRGFHPNIPAYTPPTAGLRLFSEWKGRSSHMRPMLTENFISIHTPLNCFTGLLPSP